MAGADSAGGRDGLVLVLSVTAVLALLVLACAVGGAAGAWLLSRL